MEYKQILIVTDNHYLFHKFKSLIVELNLNLESFHFFCTSSRMEILEENFKKINLKKWYEILIETYDLIISLHCKQIFPSQLVSSTKCINIHPGLNPFNRGWFPQVFSILNKLPAGATIHEMDEEVDHGNIIAQQSVDIFPWDTSLEVYNRVVETEMILLRQYLIKIVNKQYISRPPESEGNYNSIKDFQAMQKIDLDEMIRTGDFIDKLRALTHGNFNNAYFIDKKTGKKIYVKINLTVDE